MQIVHQFQGQRSRSQTHIFCTSHLHFFLIWETKYCTCVVRGGRGHTASAEPTATLLVNCCVSIKAVVLPVVWTVLEYLAY